MIVCQLSQDGLPDLDLCWVGLLAQSLCDRPDLEHVVGGVLKRGLARSDPHARVEGADKYVREACLGEDPTRPICFGEGKRTGCLGISRRHIGEPGTGGFERERDPFVLGKRTPAGKSEATT